MFVKKRWLIFLKGDALITKILKKGFGHIGVLMNDGYEWIYLSPNNYYLDVTILSGTVKEKDWPKIFEEKFEAHVIKVNVKLDLRKTMKKLTFIDNCVKRALYVSGINIRAFTPYSLYKKLVKMKDRNKYTSNIVAVEVIK